MGLTSKLALVTKKLIKKAKHLKFPLEFLMVWGFALSSSSLFIVVRLNYTVQFEDLCIAFTCSFISTLLFYIPGKITVFILERSPFLQRKLSDWLEK